MAFVPKESEPPALIKPPASFVIEAKGPMMMTLIASYGT
jgi:hypothetical protein